jgi:O-antigen ligase
MFDKPIPRLSRSERFPVLVIALAISMLPMLKPKGPANLTPVDPLVMGGVLAVLIWAATVKARIHVPYIVPFGIIVLAGAVAGLSGEAPDRAFIAIVQDMLLLAWCAAIATVARTPAAIRVLLKAWAYSAVAWGLLQIGQAVMTPGVKRTQLTFDHPNLAAGYFVVSLFVIALGRQPERKHFRIGAFLIVGVAAMAAGSNAALGGFAAGLAVALALVAGRKIDPMFSVFVLAASIVVGGLGAYVVKKIDLGEQLRQSDNAYVAFSVGRSTRSAESRGNLFEAEIDLYREHPLTGNGPSSTRPLLEHRGGLKAKEAHSDYLASLVERGPLGLIGLLALMGAVAFRIIGVQRQALADGFARVVPGTTALAAVGVTLAITSVTHEILHYRHVWTLLGIIGALYASGRKQPALQEAEA